MSSSRPGILQFGFIMSRKKSKIRPRSSRMGRELIGTMEEELAAMRRGERQKIRVVEIPGQPGYYGSRCSIGIAPYGKVGRVLCVNSIAHRPTHSNW